VVAGENGQKSQVIPSNFLTNAKLVKYLSDRQDRFFTAAGIASNNDHYRYQQQIKGYPVYSSAVLIHVHNNSQVYSIDGNISTSDSLIEGSLSEDKAKEIALAQAVKEATQSSSLKVRKAEKVVFNFSLARITDDNNNYLVWAVTINDGVVFAKRYYVRTTDGQIIYEVNLVRQALDRQIANCALGFPDCPVGRAEGEAASGDTDTDQAYDNFGTIYDFFSVITNGIALIMQAVPL
jgi:Zn-dependent metalloprotease